MVESVTEGMALSEARKQYQCFMHGEWESLEKFYKSRPMEIIARMTTNNDTALHLVAFSCRSHLLKTLIELLEKKAVWLLRHALEIENYDGNTPLHEAAVSGNLVAANLLVDKHKTSSRPEDDGSSDISLVEIRNKLGESPLYRAAAFGRTNLVDYFLSQVDKKNIEQHFQRNDRISILQIAVITQNFETALWLLKRYPYLAKRKESNGLTSLQLLAQMPSAFEAEFPVWKMLLYKYPPNQNYGTERRSNQPPNQNDDLESGSNQPPQQTHDLESGSNQPRQSSSSKKITRLLGWRPIRKMFKEMQKQTTLSELTDFLVKEEYSWGESDLSVNVKTFCLLYSNKPNKPPQVKEDADNCGCADEGETSESTYKYTPLLTATCTGIFQIVDKILKVHPQAIETRHIKTQENILHMAIKYRRLDIYNIVIEEKKITPRLASMIDNDGNSILHHAASMKFYTDTQRVISGPAFQLQEELSWMERVTKIMPPHYAMHKNNQGLTAQKLFENEHAELLDSAKVWIKWTAQSCSTVAALVATVAYAAAFTVPGGNDRKGVPVLRHSPFFFTFTVSDAVSLICSLTSLATFLSVLTSPFEYKNFHRSLPRRLHLGFFLLFFSLVATMLTFTATVVLLIHHQKRWTTSLIHVVALLPVSTFGLLQFPLYNGFYHWLKHFYLCLKHIFQVLKNISICISENEEAN